MEEPGFEPGAFRMRSGHSTTELHPLSSLCSKKLHILQIVNMTF